MTPLTLLDENLEPVEFDGVLYRSDMDRARLTGQIKRVFRAMKDGHWRTLDEIQDRIVSQEFEIDSVASISAQLRNLRKERFGGHTVEKRARGNRSGGLFEYSLTVNGDES